MTKSAPFGLSEALARIALAATLFLSAAGLPADDLSFEALQGEVTVYEDRFGIPTIKAESELDVSFAQGYVHARDRFFQMDTNRKIAAGRLAELMGEAGLSSDITFRTLGLGRAALKTLQSLDQETRDWLQSYANGVNAYLADNPLPPEYAALERTAVEPWQPLDTVLIGKLIAASFSLNAVPDLDASITLANYVGFGEAIGFDGEALFFEDTHRSEPPDDRVTAPELLAGPMSQSSTEAGQGSGEPAPKIAYTGERTVSPTTLEMAIEVRDMLTADPIAVPETGGEVARWR